MISLQPRPVYPKFQVESFPPTILLLSKLGYYYYYYYYRKKRFRWRNVRLDYLSYGIKYLYRSFFRFVTIYTFDRRTDTFLLTRPPCIQCSAVKTTHVGKRSFFSAGSKRADVCLAATLNACREAAMTI